MSSSLEGEVVGIGGIPTFVSEAGSGPALLLVQGAGPGIDAAMCWSTMVPLLSTRFRLVVPDMPGFGHSEVLKVRDTPANVALHYLAVLDHLGVDRVAVIGHSRGGRVAVEVAAADSARVSRLAILTSGSASPGGHVTDDGSYTTSATSISRFGIEGETTYEAYAAVLRTLVYTPERMPDSLLRPAYEEFMANRLEEWRERMKSDFYLDFYHREDAEPFKQKLLGLRIPTLVVCGREDTTSAWERALPLVTMISDVEFHVLSNCGHFPQLECPETLASLLLHHFDRPAEAWVA